MANYSMPEGVDFTRSGGYVWYKNTGIMRSFHAGDTIKSDVTGEVYECKPSVTFLLEEKNYRQTTDWKYLRTDITKIPNYSVTDLTLKRNSGYSFTLSWKTPSWLIDTENTRRAENFSITIETLDRSQHVTNSKIVRVETKATSYTALVFATSDSTTNYIWKRSEFSPYSDTSVNSIRFTVVAGNRHGTSQYSAKVNYYFDLPLDPEHEKYTIDRTNGDISVKWSSPLNTNTERDKIDNYVVVTVKDSRTGKTTETQRRTVEENSFTLTQSVPNRQTLEYGDYVYVNFQVTSRGIYGFGHGFYGVYESFPQKPLISVRDVSQDWVSGNVVIGVNLNPNSQADYTYGTSDVKLQVLRSVSYENPNDIPPAAPWTDVGPTEGRYCTAISLQIPDVLPSAGTKTWIRAKAWNDVEELYYRYSEPLRLIDLETPEPFVPSADDDMADVISHVVNYDGTSVDVLVGWDESGDDDSNQTEISWATNEKAWRSTKQPDAFTFGDDWDEGPITVGEKTYNKSAHVTISELEPNVKYYVSCRRVLEPDEGDTTYGPYSTKYVVNTSDVSALPQAVVLYGESSVVYGEPVQVSWSYNSPMEQQSWMIKRAVTSSGYSDDDIILATESDNRHTVKIPFFRNDDVDYPIAEGDELPIYVVVTVASVTLSSEIIKLSVLRRPEFDIVAPSTTITQPATLTVFSDIKEANVSLFVEAKGVISEHPDGTIRQVDGDTVWSGTVTPQWELIDEYASDVDVQQAKQDLDDAQEAYDAVLEDYNSAYARKDRAESDIASLTEVVNNAMRDIPTAQSDLQDARDRLENADEDDPMYSLYEARVQEAEDRVNELIRLRDDARVNIPFAEEDLTWAIEELESIDMSDEEAALEAAIKAYATAEAGAIDPTSDALAYTALIELPSGLNLIDGARYAVHGFSTNVQTGVRSDERVTAMNVSWAHQAPTLPDGMTIEAVDSTGESGARTIGTRITTERPVTAFNSDVYDVYRVTKGGVSLAAENVPLECVLSDPYATFSGEPMRYRIACRTTDGDVTWKDYTYVLSESDDFLRSEMRIDWLDGYVELERNVVPSDSYEKPFVAHTHLDGTVSGHWNAGTRRTVSVQAAMVRIYDRRQREAIEDLARYDGPCYVRTNDGVAFECNVQVDSIALNRHSARIDVSLTMTEIDSTGTFPATVEE
jgi:hypothetical protein